MSRPASPIVCDGTSCGKTKQQTNRWWTVQVCSINKSFVLTPGTADIDHMSPPDAWKAYDFCGETCALKFLSEQMGKVTS
jgi:hypothetical protein